MQFFNIAKINFLSFLSIEKWKDIFLKMILLQKLCPFLYPPWGCCVFFNILRTNFLIRKK